MRVFRDVLILAAIFGGIWALFTYVTIVPDKSYFNIPVETEESLGDDLFEWQIKNNPAFDLVEDSIVNNIMEDISARLLEHMDEPLFDYEFYVVNASTVNAFTIPGGKIFIYSGLIELAESPEEIAAVLAHEMGHAEERHVMNKMAKEIGLNVLLSGDGFVLGELSKLLGSTKFDRYQEEKADDFAFALLEKSKIDPGSFASIMRKMKEASVDMPEALEIINTHPGATKRIKKALEYRLGKSFEEVPLEADLELLKSKLDLD